MAEEETEEYPDVLEALRIGLVIVALALQAYLMWDYVKDRPEVEVTRRRMAAWWNNVAHQHQRMRKMEHETVFEAIQVVDNAGA